MMMLIETLGWVAILTSPITVFYVARMLKNGSKRSSTHV